MSRAVISVSRAGSAGATSSPSRTHVTEPLVPTTTWPTARYVNGERIDVEDVLTTEGPVEFRISGVPIAVLMRTPGRDESLATGS